MMKNKLYQLRKVIMKLKKDGVISKQSIPDINGVLRNMEYARVPKILERLEEEKILSKEQVESVKKQLFESKTSLKSPIFRLNNVIKSYKTPEGIFWALKGITLTIYQAEILAILGFSGSGKSTLLNVLGLLTTAGEGSDIIYRGTHYHELNRKERDNLRKQEFGFIFQESHLLSHLKVTENVALPLRLQKYSNGECVKRAEEMLARFMTKNELENKKSFFNKKPHQLSGGQKQRVAAARAMVHQPRVIFADEPTGSLDFDTGQMVMEALFEAARDHNVTVVLVTHNHSQARQYCERFIWMEDGKLKNHFSGSVKNTMRLVKQLTGKDLKR